MYKGGFGAACESHSEATPKSLHCVGGRAYPELFCEGCTQNHPYTCVSHSESRLSLNFEAPQNYFLLKKYAAMVIMAAARFSSDELDLFHGPISQEENQRQRKPLEPERNIDFR